MSVKETIVMTRASADVLWPHEALPPSAGNDGQAPYTANSVLSSNNLTLTVNRVWNSDEAFITEKSESFSVDDDRAYFTYIVSNNIKVTRTYENI